MNAITIESKDDKFLISIEKGKMDKDFLIRLVERLRFEILAQKVDFDEDIEVLGAEIKSKWWKENKRKLV